MTGKVSPAVWRRRLGAELRQMREDSSLRLEDVATELGLVSSSLSRIETGKAPTRTSYLVVLLDLYGIHDPGQRRRFADMALEGQRREWFADAADLLPSGVFRYLGLETATRELRSLALHTVPELLQTAAYAQAVLRASRPGLDEEQVRQLSAITRGRQERLVGEGHAVHIIIDEAALLRPVGSARVMVGQLSHLAAVTQIGQTSVQVAGLGTAWPVLTGPFTLLTLPDQADPDVACVPGFGGQMTITSDPASLSALRDVFDQTTRVAHSLADSAALISKLATAPENGPW